jgi:uncharacterized protein YjgD (DUF1641 family)
MTTAAPDRVAELERKLDAISGQLAVVTDELREQRLRREQWDELRADLAPIATEAMVLASRELEEVQDFVRPEDLLRLLRRLLRNTNRIEASMEKYESLMEFLDDAGGLTGEAFAKLLALLEEYEQKGYFEFVGAAAGVVDRIVTGFSEEDVESLGDNVVLILQTVKEMTQPEIMAILYRMIEAIQRQQAVIEAEDEEPPSFFTIAKQMRDPEIRRGMSRALNTLKAVSDLDTGPPRMYVVGTEEHMETREPSEGGK